MMTYRTKDGDTLDLGNKTLKFIGAPNLLIKISITSSATRLI